MKLSIGIVGLPNVGKSTLFNLLTKQQVLAANYPFATIDPNVGIVPVPDERVDKLAEIADSKKKIPAVVEFYDIAGLVKGANQGEGLGNQFLAHIRETQAIIVVLRVFRDDNVVHVENSVDPLRDLEIINTELALKDLEAVEKRLARAEGEARTSSGQAGDKEAKMLFADLQIVQQHLSAGRLLSALRQTEHSHILENVRVLEMNLLTAKKQLYLLNGAAEDVPPDLIAKIKSLDSDYVVLDLGQPPEHSDILENVGISALIKKSYEILDLISFFTTGEDETRAWTIERGTKAPQAAGVIHTDFEKKFIRAEAIEWRKL